MFFSHLIANSKFYPLFRLDLGVFGAACVMADDFLYGGERGGSLGMRQGIFPAAYEPFPDSSRLGEAAPCHPRCRGNKQPGDCRKLSARSVYLKSARSESRFKQWRGARKMCWSGGKGKDEEGRC